MPPHKNQMKLNSSDLGPLLARVLLSFVFLYSGIGKLMAPDATIAYIAKAGIPLPAIAYAAALFVEVVIATAFLLGYKTKVTALALLAFTFVSALLFHSNFGDKSQLISFLKNLAICGGLLQVLISSPGTLLARQPIRQ